MVRTGLLGLGELRAIHQVDAEQSTEEQDLGDQERPNPERSALLLLLRVFEVMEQTVRMIRSVVSHGLQNFVRDTDHI